MAQLERFPRQVNTSRSFTTPTVDKLLLRGGESYKGSPTSTASNSPTSEDDSGHHQKKSVLTKVKEKAKKLRYSLSKKRHEDGNVTPTWGVSTIEDEEEEEDAEYLGAPMYESELAPEAYKENARQHPRATPVIAEIHILRNPSKSRLEFGREKSLSCGAESMRTTQLAATSNINPRGSNKIMTGNLAQKTPAYTNSKGSDAPLSTSSRIQGLAVSKPTEMIQTPSSAPSLRRSPLSVTTPQTPPAMTASKISPVASQAPRFSSAPSTPRKSASSSSATVTVKSTNSNDQTWGKDVSVKEYFINKLEPGEDEKALSRVISEAMGPRRTPGDVGVMEKVREAVTSLLRNDEPSQYGVKTPTTRSSSHTQTSVSSNVRQVDGEENHGRILQTN